MYQNFDDSSAPDKGPARLDALRKEMEQEDLTAYLVPRADAHQGEYVPARDERLSWLTGFTGSAGFAAILKDEAGIFVDGRYRLQVRDQVANVFSPVDWPETQLGDWLGSRLGEGDVLGFDPWLHTARDIKQISDTLAPKGVTLRHVDNLIDRIWENQPDPPSGKAEAYPLEFADKDSGEKRKEIAEILRSADQDVAILTQPDSICWLLNIRGSDLPRLPIVLGFAAIHADASVDFYTARSKFSHLDLDEDIRLHPISAFAPALAQLSGRIRVDKSRAPLAVSDILTAAGADLVWGEDPCLIPKACKNPAEIAGTREAHLRDGAAMVEFLAWLHRKAPSGKLNEIEVTKKLENFRRSSNALRGISFDTICGSGPHGAIVHYRVTKKTNRKISKGELLLIDSGGQYLDGTTDITRTIAVGEVGEDEKSCFTRVLQGMIAISLARWPRGLSGRELDSLARAPLWRAGLDYDHGTGHGVGSYLSVHEGPQGLSRRAETPLREGMIVSNEPGYYRPGAFGIRIENLVVVKEADKIGDARDQLGFETLTFVPIDRSLIRPEMLGPEERNWLNAYHAEVAEKIGPRVEGETLAWLTEATAPI